MTAAAPPSKPKAEKAKAPPKKAAASGPKKPRAPRKDYGFHKLATIRVTKHEDGKAPTFKGQRADWYAKLQASNGKSVESFLKANEGKDPPRGWLRFFVEAGCATLDQSSVPAEKPKAEKKEKAA